MPLCSSCGRVIPEGQGSSCSMCYGDIDYGLDGYYRAEREAEEERHAYEQQREAEEESR